MPKYRIVWVSSIYSESWVEAKDEAEAKAEANAGKDKDFEPYPDQNDWEIHSVEPIED